MPWSIRTMLMLALAGALFQLYVAMRAIPAIALITGLPKTRLRVGASAIILYLAVLPLSSLLGYAFGFNTSFQSSSLFDRVFTYPFWIGIAYGVQTFILLVAIDLVRLFLVLVYRRKKAGWRFVEAWVIAATVVLAALYVGARVYTDTFRLRTVGTEFRVSGLPSGLSELRIVHIADIQVDNRTNGGKLDAYIDTVNKLKPDLILFSGDAVTSGTSFVEQAAEAMSRLQARFGTYACLGDHDYFADRKLVADQLQVKGIVVLENKSVAVPINGDSVVITGVTNVYRNNVALDVVDQLARERPASEFSILLTHQPSTWLVKLAADRDYNLFLGGHTHGGQIAFLLPGFLLTGSSFETRYVTGFYDVGSLLVSINNGLGLTLAPIRYQAPAEVTLIVLKGSA
ncbi:MAG: metallophosphoesterase [Blastocatellia bacterium]